jgi:hypothetical protein
MADNESLPAEIDLDKLFHRRSVFDSSDDMSAAGFKVLRESKREKVVVASHRDAPGYLFKKFLNDVSISRDEQLAVYRRRVDGANALRAHLDLIGSQTIIVPKKWLCELPPRFDARGKPAHIVVVQRCNILDREESERQYHRIDKQQLYDLCTIFFCFKRVDFTAKNAPYTPTGKIAFIDTGYLVRITKKLRSRKKSYGKNIAKLFTDKNRRFAAGLWNELLERKELLGSTEDRRGRRRDR